MEFRPKQVNKPQEHRIKVALKDKPKSSKKAAAVKNKQKPIKKAPPMPKGKQLEKLPQAPKKVEPKKKTLKQDEPIKKIQQKKPTQAPKTSKKKTIYKKKEELVKKDLNVSKKPKKSGLYAALSKKQKTKTEKKVKSRSGTHIGSDFKEAYGEAFGKLSEGEKKYIIDNQEIMRRITQEQLNRLGPVNIPRNLNVNTSNIIEFYLHPNGDISGLRIVNDSGYEILDDTSKQTIEYSYHRYPLPKQKTLVRYKVGYYLAGRRR